MSDLQVRTAALETGRNILLQAPAGSGKTTVLVQRFLRALATVQEPEEVLAITFTRKAAAEMRERVLLALEAEFAATHPESSLWAALRTSVLTQAAARGWVPEELPTRLRIQTIDSLNHELARAMPVLGRLQTSLTVTDDPVPLYEEAARLCLRQIEEDPVCQPDADLLLQRLDNRWEQAAVLLSQMLAHRNRWQPVLLDTPPDQLGARVLQTLERIITAQLQQACERVPEELRRKAAQLASTAAEHLQKPGAIAQTNDLNAVPAALIAWQALADLALTREHTWRKQIAVGQGFPPAERALKQEWKDWRDAMRNLPDMQQLLQGLRQLPLPVMEPDDDGALAALARVLLLAAAHLKLVFRDRGQVDHDEVAAVARQALRDLQGPTELAMRQTLRIRHLLVDEFQDTSPEQLELLRALTQGWDDAEERSLFLVGDPMQSIYLFRNAEVGLFLHARAEGVGATRLDFLQLNRNFRSVPALVDWVNGAFASVFPRIEDARRSAIAFLAAHSARSAPEPPVAVAVWPQSSASPELEATSIAEEIQRLRNRAPALRIAILVQARTHAAPILHALQLADIATQGVDLASLADRPVVRDLVALGQSLQSSMDRTAWLAVLHAPFCGLTLADLLVLTTHADRGPLVPTLTRLDELVKLSDEGRERLRRVGPLLATAWQQRGRSDTATRIESLWRQLGGPNACEDAGELRAAEQFLHALRRLQAGGATLDARRLQRLAAELRDAGDAGGGNPVQVMTIHHAKGLEWDVVFVPGLGRRIRSDRPPLLRWLQLPAQDGVRDLLMAVRSIGEADAVDPLSGYIATLQKDRARNERVRLAYVAVTRARERLYLSGHATPRAPDGQRAPAAGSLLACLWPAVHVSFATQAGTESIPLPEPVAQRTAAAPWRRLPSNWVPQFSVQLPRMDTLARSVLEARSGPEYSWVGPLARAAGSVLHGELERHALQPDSLFAAPAAQVPRFMAQLRGLGIAAAAARGMARNIVAQLDHARQDPRLQWILSQQHREARSEWRLSGIVDGELRSVAIDRSFVDGDTRWVIDYKTSSHSGGGLDEFLRSELARYAPQLRQYIALAQRAGAEPVRAALYFPVLRRFVELDPVSA